MCCGIKGHDRYKAHCGNILLVNCTYSICCWYSIRCEACPAEADYLCSYQIASSVLWKDKLKLSFIFFCTLITLSLPAKM